MLSALSLAVLSRCSLTALSLLSPCSLTALSLQPCAAHSLSSLSHCSLAVCAQLVRYDSDTILMIQLVRFSYTAYTPYTPPSGFALVWGAAPHMQREQDSEQRERGGERARSSACAARAGEREKGRGECAQQPAAGARVRRERHQVTGVTTVVVKGVGSSRGFGWVYQSLWDSLP